jgi:hypothetical protein
MIALGIAQRTVLLPAPRAVATAHAAKDVRYVVVPGSALRAHPGQQRVHIEGAGPVFAAYGRSADVTAWLSGERYQQVGIPGQGSTTASTELATAHVLPALKTATPHPDPDGADVWLDQQRGSRSLDWTLNLPASVSLLVAADGTSAAPSTITVTWPVHVTTPYATPLIVGGSVLVVIGLLLYMWALVHLKRRRGPRRKSPPPPPGAPRLGRARMLHPAGADGVLRRVVATGGVAVAGAALLAGCSAAPATSAAPVERAVAARTTAIPESQAQRIVRDALTVAERADAKRKVALLAPRFAGPALVLRKAAYAARKHDKQLKLPQALPASTASIRVVLPEATSTWPRTLFAVVTDSAKPSVAPQALTLVQDDPRSPYRVRYAMSLARTLPVLAPSVSGAKRLQNDTRLLRVRPVDLPAAYGLLLRHPKAPAAAMFDTSSDSLMKTAGAAAKKRISKRLGSTARIRFSDTTKQLGPVIAMATADGGAIVAVNLKEAWTVKPVKDGVTVKPSGATKALAKVGSTAKGIVSTYGYQLLFAVPAAGSKSPVELLGYAQGLTSAKEL